MVRRGPRTTVAIGIGTGIGKTTTTVALVRALRARGVDAVGGKAIEIGRDADERARRGFGGHPPRRVPR